MAKKYLSLEEAAGQLGLSNEELFRLRERGDIRGFADRGTWKFKLEDVEEFARRRQADSDPDVPLIGDDDDVLGEQPTVISSSALDDDESDQPGPSDSDVRLIAPTGAGSDSDVRLIVDPSLSDKFGSDPDVVAVDDDGTDSDVRLVADADSSKIRRPGGIPGGSDSDVRLIAPTGAGSDSDVQLIGRGVGDTSRSDIYALGTDEGKSGSDDSGLSLPDEQGSSLVLGDEGVLDDESGMTLKADSGLTLENADSGISLESFDSGIALAGDSGIGLAADSGISLESADSGTHGTIPMMDAVGAGGGKPTDQEVPTMGDDSEFELSMDDDDTGSDTSVILFDEEDDLDDHHATTVRKSADVEDEFGESETFDLDSGQEAAEFDDGEELEVAEDILGEDDELDDVFGADDEDFDDGFESGSSHAEFVAPLGGPRVEAAAEADWGAGTFVGLIVSTTLMALCAMVMFDLTRSIWSWSEPTAANSAILEMLRGMF